MASKVVKSDETDDGSLTPSESSDGERSEHDSDYETEHEEEETECEQPPNIAWTGYGKKVPVIMFRGEVVIKKRTDYKAVGERYHMAYKMGSSDCRIVRNILNTHGFKEVHPNSSDYNIMWTGSHLKPFTLRGLTEFQKINHFPRSYEITRKDRLFKNVQRMQQLKGSKHFDFVAQSFIMPSEYQDFCSCFMKEKGTWIVKPVASSRGRGVFLINHPEQIPLDDNLIVSKYISNPILIDGFKFDVRLYIAVTSYDPIVIYLYEEGLTRFATVKYEKANKHIRNQCMHLTNYSVNKKNKDYVQNDDPDIEDYGNKWSLGALLRYLKSQKRDVTALMMRIEDVIIKTIISAELPIATACKMFMPFKGNCFELYGFDILIDENLKPWVLEVNLSPSLACDAPLDLKIKANMISDLLSVSGLICQDPMLRTLQQSRRNQELSSRIGGRTKSAHYRSMPSFRLKTRPQSAGSKGSAEASKGIVDKQTSQSMVGLTGEEIKIVRKVKEEEQRKGGWVRIFPSPDSWDLYGPFLQFSSTHNAMVHQRLYPDRHKNLVNPLTSKASSTSLGSRNKNAYSQLTTHLSKLDFQGDAYTHASLRTRQYLRKLSGNGDSKRKHRRRKLKSATDSAKQSASRRRLVQGVMEEGGEEDGEEEETESVEQQMKMDPRVSKQMTCPETPVDKQPAAENSLPVPQSNPLPAKETSPKLNLLEMLVTGEGALNKVQARTAFAMYLIRVQQRLLAECNSHNAEDIDALNEQMDLVLRFLKRAAVNLQQAFKVVVPSRKLPLNDRRRILAKQLGNFVHVYTKETDQLKVKQDSDKRGVRRTSSKEGLNEDKFEKFINLASEAELEEVLTTYTKLNKSASIFLGTKSPDKTSSGIDANKQENVLPKRKELASSNSDTSKALPFDPPTSHGHPPPTFIGWEEIPYGGKVHTVHIDSRTGERKLMSRPGSGRNAPATIYTTPSAAAFANAVAIYSTKLTRSRPSSASSYKSGVRVTHHRPSSAVSSRASSASRSERGYVDDYNEKAINEALQRLAAKQQARQYSASNSLGGLTDLPNPLETLCRSTSQQNIRTEVFRTRSLSTGDTTLNQTPDPGKRSHGPKHAEEGKYVAIEQHKQNSRPPSGVQSRPVARNDRDSSKTEGKLNHFKKFDSFVDDSWQNDPHMAGVNSGYASHGNKTYKMTQQQQLVKQQRLMAQSKALLESSKAKHLAMVAQAHAAQNITTSAHPVSSSYQTSTQPVSTSSDPQLQQFEPRPPSQPVSAKKLTSSQHRISRTLSGDYGMEPDLYSSSQSRPRHSIHS